LSVVRNLTASLRRLLYRWVRERRRSMIGTLLEIGGIAIE
jgi:hypothetical protein